MFRAPTVAARTSCRFLVPDLVAFYQGKLKDPLGSCRTGDVTSTGRFSRRVGPNDVLSIVNYGANLWGGSTYNAFLDFSHFSLLPWSPGGNVWRDGLESHVLLYISDGHQDRAYDHKSFLGLNVFK